MTTRSFGQETKEPLVIAVIPSSSSRVSSFLQLLKVLSPVFFTCGPRRIWREAMPLKLKFPLKVTSLSPKPRMRSFVIGVPEKTCWPILVTPFGRKGSKWTSLPQPLKVEMPVMPSWRTTLVREVQFWQLGGEALIGPTRSSSIEVLSSWPE